MYIYIYINKNYNVTSIRGKHNHFLQTQNEKVRTQSVCTVLCRMLYNKNEPKRTLLANILVPKKAPKNKKRNVTTNKG